MTPLRTKSFITRNVPFMLMLISRLKPVRPAGGGEEVGLARCDGLAVEEDLVALDGEGPELRLEVEELRLGRDLEFLPEIEIELDGEAVEIHRRGAAGEIGGCHRLAVDI